MRTHEMTRAIELGNITVSHQEQIVGNEGEARAANPRQTDFDFVGQPFVVGVEEGDVLARSFLEGAVARRAGTGVFLADDGERNPVDTLSEKEFKVFLALAKGKSVQDIADVMSLSPRTVGTHLYNIKQKLGASNSAELAIIAIRAGLIET